MCQIAINIPNEVLFETKMNEKQAIQFARCAVALGYYTQSGVSIGYCAQIAGMAEEEFIKYLGRNHVSIFCFDNREEFLEEVGNA
jgi:predicted HTH domain antitoxin